MSLIHNYSDRCMMRVTVIIFAILLKVLYVENNVFPAYNVKEDSSLDETEILFNPAQKQDTSHEKVIGLKAFDETDQEYGFDLERKHLNERTKKPCSIVVLSNNQNPSMQSLLRKYRYDANGVLIPSSVKYFIKLPQGLRTSPILVPLNDKAFSPLGGFVRYYKEVPPIPPSW